MAIKDVKEYYYTMLAQFLEEKQNLADFEAALKDGLITEEQMQDALSTVSKLEDNYHRLAYIMYLFGMPNNASKKKKYVRQYKPILDEFSRLGVDMPSVKLENDDALRHFKSVLNALKKGE
jgi:hypothetical protein